MSGRRSFVAVVFALLLGVSVLAVGCANSGGPTSPSPTTVTTTVLPPARTTLSVGGVIPSAPVTFTYGDSISVDVSWEMTAEDWAKATNPGVIVCVGQERDTIVADACRGKGLSAASGSLPAIPATIPARAPSNTVPQTNFIQVFLVRDRNLSPYQENITAEEGLHFPLNRLSPLLVGDPSSVERSITWTSR